MKSDRVMIFESMRIATKYLDPDTRLKIYDALLDYAFYEEEPEFEEGTVEHSLFAAFRPIVKNSTDNVENGKKGGRPTAKKDGKNPPLNPRIENAESGDKNPPLNQEKRREEKGRRRGREDGYTARTLPFSKAVIGGCGSVLRGTEQWDRSFAFSRLLRGKRLDGRQKQDEGLESSGEKLGAPGARPGRAAGRGRTARQKSGGRL